MVEEQKDVIVAEIAPEIKEEDNGLKPSMLEAKIIRQVEYYFGNVNLWRDKFLKEKRQEDDGWVTIECLTTFNRLQTLSMDFDEIVNALQKSKTGLLEIHESRTKVRRSLDKPLPDQDDPILRKTSKMKTLYIKGFPTTHTLDDIQDFILSHECQNIFIKMRLDNDKKFKGSIIVELATLDEAKKLLDGKIKVNDQVLTVMTREDYFKYKAEKGGGARPHQGKENDNKEDLKDIKPKKYGCVLHFKGASESTSREDLKEIFGKHDEEIEWVDFSRGETQGYVRFVKENCAKTVLEAMQAANDGKVVVKEMELEVRLIEGIEEVNYWILAAEERKRPKFQGFKKKKFSKGAEGWRKRRRPWESKPKSDSLAVKEENTDIKDEKPAENTHIKFEESETVDKKSKVEA